MKEFFIKLKNLSIITIIAALAMGIALLMRPSESITVVSILCGVTMIALGVCSWLHCLIKDKSALLAVVGTVCAIAGIVVCVKYKSIIAILLFLFGVFITMSGAIDLITSFYSRGVVPGFWGVSAILSVITVVFGIIIMVNPTGTSEALVRLAGAGLIVYAAVDLAAFIEIRKAAKQIKEELKNIEPPVVDSSAVEVNSDEIDSDAKEI